MNLFFDICNLSKQHLVFTFALSNVNSVFFELICPSSVYQKQKNTVESYNSFKPSPVYKNIQTLIITLIVFTILGVNILAIRYNSIFQEKVFIVTILLILSVMIWCQTV